MKSIRQRHGGRPLVLSTTGSVAWATGGLSLTIDRVASLDPVWVVVLDEATTLVASLVEVARLRDEYPLGELGFSIVSAAWYESDAHLRQVERLVGADIRDCLVEGDGPGTDVTFELVAERMALSRQEVEVLNGLGRVAASTVEEVVRSWRPGRSTDYEIAGEVQLGLEKNGAQAVCLIVGGDERVRNFRHPVMVGSVVEVLLMVVVVARAQGLHVALTRIACRERDDRLEARLEAIAVVNERVLAATRVGATWGDVYGALGAGYEEIGMAEAWREHFQGGPIAYAQREFELAPGSSSSPWWSVPITSATAVAWNPSLAGGAKLEDTYMVGAGGLTAVTATGEWPRRADHAASCEVLVL